MTFGIQYSGEVLLQDLLPTGQFRKLPVKMANELSKIILWMSQKCVCSARQFRKISIKAWIYSTCKSQLQLSHIYPHQPPQLGGFLLNRYGNPVPAGFFREKKGIQVGSKLEDLIVSVVIFGHPFDKYAQVKFDHETPKIIKKSGYHQKFLKPPPSAMNHQVSLENSKSYQAVPAKLIADSGHQNITEALLAALIQTDSLTSCGKYNSQNFNNHFCMQKSRFAIWMSSLIL